MNFKYVAFRNFFSVISDHWSWYFVLATTEDGRRSCWWLGRCGSWYFALTSTEDGRSRWGGSRGLPLPRVWLANCMCHHLLWLLQSRSLLPGLACSEVGHPVLMSLFKRFSLIFCRYADHLSNEHRILFQQVRSYFENPLVTAIWF